MRSAVSILFVLSASTAQAATPGELLDSYRVEAVRQSAGFTPSAARGGAFYAKAFNVSAKMPACTSCHTDSPAQAGRHAVTDKAIKPLAPSANADRFSDPAKVEKWFRRNCTEVVGRECIAAEKADFVAFLMGGR
jgi:hypothetical protein